MEQTFWKDRWAQGQIGFHQGRPNELLVEHVQTLEGKKRVLVPLCGKSVDLRYLAERGHEVVGIELVRDALVAFFAEQEIVAEAVRIGPYEGLRGAGITLLPGDFFAAETEHLGAFDALYDRAALVALPAAMREAYVATCTRLLTKDARGLLITFEYDQARLDGPPFSIDDPTVRALYAGYDVTMLKERVEAPGPRFTAAGIADAFERIYRLAR